MMVVLYLVPPGPLASVFIFLSFYRIVIVLSLSLPIYRNSVGTVFLIVSFPNDNTETCGTILHHKRSYPPFFRLHSHYFLVQFSGCPCIASAQITPSTYKREFIVLCLQALEMIPIRQLLNLALPPWGRERHFFPNMVQREKKTITKHRSHCLVGGYQVKLGVRTTYSGGTIQCKES